MNSVVFIFVPFDGSRREFDTKLRDCLAAVEASPAGERPAQAEGRHADADELPLWTWFVPGRTLS